MQIFFCSTIFIFEILYNFWTIILILNHFSYEKAKETKSFLYFRSKQQMTETNQQS